MDDLRLAEHEETRTAAAVDDAEADSTPNKVDNPNAGTLRTILVGAAAVAGAIGIGFLGEKIRQWTGVDLIWFMRGKNN